MPQQATFWKNWPLLHIKGWRKGTGTEQVWEAPQCSLLQFTSWWTNMLLCLWTVQKGSTFFSLEVCVMHMWCPCPVPGHTLACWDHAGGVGALLQWPAPAQRVQQNPESWRLLQEQQGTCSGFKSFIPCVCVCLLCCTRHGSRYRIDTGCHMFCSVMCGVSAQCSAADEYSGLVVKPSVHRRECIENQTSGCYSGADGAELNSLMMKTVKSQAFLGEKRLMYCYEACLDVFAKPPQKLYLLSVLNILRNKYQNYKQVFGGFLS